MLIIWLSGISKGLWFFFSLLLIRVPFRVTSLFQFKSLSSVAVKLCSLLFMMVMLLFLGSHEILVICVFSSFTSLLIPVSVLILFLQSSVHISGISVIFTCVSLPSVSSCLTLVVFCLLSLVLLPLSRYS